MSSKKGKRERVGVCKNPLEVLGFFFLFFLFEASDKIGLPDLQ